MIEIYKASAGSGKTYTLTREYIKFILGHKGEDGVYRLNSPGASTHSAVLAITFTNKATEEMKSRIIHQLAVLAEVEPGWEGKSPYLNDFLATFKDATPEKIRRTALAALKALLFNFDRFSISTIDAFFQKVLRSFAHEADVSGSYQVELDDRAVLTASVDAMLSDLNHDSDSPHSAFLMSWLIKLMLNEVEEGNSFDIFNRDSKMHQSLIDFINEVRDDDYKAHYQEIMDYFGDYTRLESFIRELKSLIGRLRSDAKSRSEEALAAIDSGIGRDSGCVSKNLVNLLAAWSVDGYVKTLGNTAASCLENPDKLFTAKGRKSPQATETLVSALLDALMAISACHKEVSYLQMLSSNVYQLGLVASVSEYLDRYRRENSTLLLSDTNSLLARIIGNEDTPFIYEKLGNRFRHYLIDEFQDTSFSQWNVLSPLVGESIARGNDNLVIGDEKQCIYRFRNSDPRLLAQLHLDRIAGDTPRVRGQRIEENTNWRSSADVIRFNNTLFTSIASAVGQTDIYGNVAQMISPAHRNHRGYVRMCLYHPPGEDEVHPALVTLGAELKRQLKVGYKAGDIAVLVRTWAEGEKVIRYLEELRGADPDYPQFTIVSDKSLLVSRSRAVQLIVSRLRYISAVGPAADRHKRIRRETRRVFSEYDAAICEGLEPSDALVKALDTVAPEGENDRVDDPLRRSDLVSLVESIIAEHIDPMLRREDNAFLTAFQDLVADFITRGKADIRSFLQWWDDKGVRTSISGGKDRNALNILTMHKSKGLEYQCVHVPFAESSNNKESLKWFRIPPVAGLAEGLTPPWMPLRPAKSMEQTPLCGEYAVHIEEKLVDRLNLLYVAFTRAVSELIVGVTLGAKTYESLEPGESLISPDNFLLAGVRGCSPQACAKWQAQRLSDRFSPSLDIFQPLEITDGDDCRVVVCGSPTVPPDEKIERTSAMYPFVSVPMFPYEISASPSIWENTSLDTSDIDRRLTARERGLIIHEIMSQIRSREDVDKALGVLGALPSTIGATEEERSEIEAVIRTRVSDPRALQWFEGFDRVLIERDVVTAAGEVKRFDRVVWLPSGEVHLIDYKSGSQPPKRYYRQIRGYLDFFRSAGIPGVRAFLYYLDKGEIEELKSEEIL